jgi:hypothetical protein
MLHSIVALLHDYNMVYDAKQHRLRCMGHIINLSVNSFLFVMATDDIEIPQEEATLTETLNEIQNWRRFGPLGMLHNIVVNIQASPQRIQEFCLLSKNRRPARDNKTRWNSWAHMLNVNTKSPVCEAIQKYLQRHPLDDIADDTLSAEDWETLQQIHEFLDLLATATLELESSSSTLDGVLPAMDLILSHYEDYKIKYQGETTMEAMINAGWRKMNKYYQLTEESSAYIAALVLNPNFKWQYVEHNWDATWLPDAKIMMKVFWEEQYKPQDMSISVPLTSSESTTVQPKYSLKDFKRAHQQVQIFEDEYAHYCAQDCALEVIPLVWWLEQAQQKKYPNLSRMAIDVLSIPAMSAEPERVFSGAKHTLTQHRNKLGIELIRAFECLKSWYKLKEFDMGFALRDELCGEDHSTATTLT